MQNKYTYPTFWPFLALLINRIIDNEASQAPKRIGKYVLKKNLKRSKNFSFGIYGDGKATYFAKIWRGTVLDINYYNLVNEYRVIETLKNRVLDKEVQNILVPGVHDTIDRKNLFAVFYPYLKGRRLTSYNETTQKRVMEKVINSIESWSDTLSKNKSIRIRGENPILTLPFFTLMLCINEPGKSKRIIKMATSSWLWFYNNRKSKKVFMHGDLSPDNIISTQGKVWLLDWEEACSTFPDFDLNYLVVTQPNDFWMRSMRRIYANRMNKNLQTYIALRQAFFNIRNSQIKNQLISRIYV